MTDQAKLDPETLVAYVDKELPPEKSAAVEAALIHDAEARETVRLLRMSAAAAAHAFDGVLREPVPVRVLQALNPAAPAARARKRWVRQLLPLAAGFLGLAVGLGAGLELAGFWGGGKGQYVPAASTPDNPLDLGFQSSLSEALDHGAEGEIFAYKGTGADTGRVRLGPSVATGLEADCRSFSRWETRSGVASSGGGIACRGREAAWSVMLLPGTGS